MGGVLLASTAVASDASPTVTFTRLSEYDGGATNVAGGENLVYSNTGSATPFPPGVDRRIADDIFLTELCGCRLTRFDLTVGGGGNGGGEPFSVDIGLYEGCPNTGGTLIPGTSIVANLPDDDTYVVEVDLGESFVEIPAGVWLAVEFDRNGAGWFVGEPPEVGFSDDVYDFPGFNCIAQVAGGFYASFASRVYCFPPGAPSVITPQPPDGSLGVSTNVTLAWNGGVPPVTASAPDETEETADYIEPEDFVSGTEHPDVFLEQWQDAVARGEVPDPALRNYPAPAPRTYFGPESTVAGFEVPQVTQADIFLYEDSEELLLSNFSNGALFNMMGDASAQVLAEHGDNFDFVAFWINFVPHHQIGGAFYLGLANNVTGIGLNTFNNTGAYGLNTDELQGWVMMWNQANWSEGYFTGTQLVLGQEFEHRFGMYLADLPGGRPLQGNNGSCGRSGHWNFRVDGQGSGMEIPEWVGSSPANRTGGTLQFNNDIPDSVFSYPDLYLMGYVPGSEMDTAASELRYMDDNANCNGTYDGPISTWDSGDIVATNGARTPGFVEAQKHFSTAWVMIHLPGSPPTNNQLNRVVSMLNTWNDVWINSTLNRGTMSNVLNPVEPQLCSVNYDVFVDTADPPLAAACTGTTEKFCDPGVLDLDQTYYWQVVATNEFGMTDGPVWTFDTLSAIEDCNSNGVDDAEDIASGDSADCNANQTPDDCEPDNDADGVPNDCDICAGGNDLVDSDSDGVPNDCDPCPDDNPDDPDGDGVCQGIDNCSLPNPDQADCTENGIGDTCEIAGGFSEDNNDNGIPDQCEEGIPAVLLAEDSLGISCGADSDCTNLATCVDGICYAGKNRFISVATNPLNAGLMTARRLRLDNGGTPTVLGWMGEPELLKLVGEADPVLVSRVVDLPYYADWSTLSSDTIHLGDCHIATDHLYIVDAVFEGFDVGEESNFSLPLSLPTVERWADVVGNDAVSPADGLVTFVDIQATVLGFQGMQLISKIYLELEGQGNPDNVPDVQSVNFADIFRTVEGFQAGAYPFADPTQCP
jgi:hypothetical protein